MKKINMDMLKKVIIGTVAGLVIIAACLLSYQSKKIDNLEHDLFIKQEATEQEFDYTETEALAKTIEETLNYEGKFLVFAGSVNIKHKYILNDQTILGIKQTETLSATANCYYEYTVALNQAKVTAKGKTINIELPKVILNEEATHRIPNTMHIIEDETDSSFFSTKAKAQKAARYWEDTFDKRANERIVSLYEEQELQDMAIVQVKHMIETLLTKDVKININIK